MSCAGAPLLQQFSIAYKIFENYVLFLLQHYGQHLNQPFFFSFCTSLLQTLFLIAY